MWDCKGEITCPRPQVKTFTAMSNLPSLSFLVPNHEVTALLPRSMVFRDQSLWTFQKTEQILWGLLGETGRRQRKPRTVSVAERHKLVNWVESVLLYLLEGFSKMASSKTNMNWKILFRLRFLACVAVRRALNLEEWGQLWTWLGPPFTSLDFSGFICNMWSLDYSSVFPTFWTMSQSKKKYFTSQSNTHTHTHPLKQVSQNDAQPYYVMPSDLFVLFGERHPPGCYSLNW